MALVLDASAVAAYLLDADRAEQAHLHLERDADLHVPHLAVVETASVVRGWTRAGLVPQELARAALADLADLPARRWPHEPFLLRAWELRDNATLYDGVYVALAESLDAPLVTCDERLARGLAGIARCDILIVAPSQGEAREGGGRARGGD